MEREQAQGLVLMLVAAFRPRDFGRTTEALYVDALIDLEFDEAQRAVRWGIRDGWRFLPSIAQLRAEIRDDYAAPRFEPSVREALPGAKALPAGDLAPLEAAVTQIGGKHGRRLSSERHIDYDEREVARRKREAKAAAKAERARLRAVAK